MISAPLLIDPTPLATEIASETEVATPPPAAPAATTPVFTYIPVVMPEVIPIWTSEQDVTPVAGDLTPNPVQTVTVTVAVPLTATPTPTVAPAPTEIPTPPTNGICDPFADSQCECPPGQLPALQKNGTVACVVRSEGVFPGEVGERLPDIEVEKVVSRNSPSQGKVFDVTLKVEPAAIKPILRPKDIARAKRNLKQRFKMNEKQIQRELRGVRAILDVRVEPMRLSQPMMQRTLMMAKSSIPAGRTASGALQRIRSRWNRVTVRGLTAGAYRVTYRVEIVLPSVTLGFSGVSRATTVVLP